jgi:DME family drug/metabolite transporter
MERSVSIVSVGSARASSALLVVAGVLWGTGGLASALLQDSAGLSPASVAAYRLLVGGVLATTVCLGQLHYLRDRVAVRRLLVAGGLLAEFQVAYQLAVAQISVSLATLITIGSAPVFVAVVRAVQERRVPATRMSLAVLGAVVGLVLLVGEPSGVAPWRAVFGVSMSLLAGGGFATLTLVTARQVAGQHVVTAAALLFGGVLITPFALATGGMGVSLEPSVLGLLLYLGVVPTAVAYGAYILGLRHAHPTVAALTAMLEPLTATVLSVVLHDERLGVVGILGACLIASALAFAPRETR